MKERYLLIWDSVGGVAQGSQRVICGITTSSFFETKDKVTKGLSMKGSSLYCFEIFVISYKVERFSIFV